MATYFSDHFHSYDEDGDLDITVADSQRRPPSGANRARIHYKRAEFTQDLSATDPDTVRLMQFKSGDRLLELFWTSTDSGSNGAIDLGLFKSGYAHDGAVIDPDVILDNQGLTSALDHVERAASGTPDADLFRGKPLWEFGNLGDGTYTVDPMEDWDLVLTCKTATDVATTFVVEAYYTSGD